MVCLRNISINTLHKGDDDDDDNNNNNFYHVFNWKPPAKIAFLQLFPKPKGHVLSYQRFLPCIVSRFLLMHKFQEMPTFYCRLRRLLFAVGAFRQQPRKA